MEAVRVPLIQAHGILHKQQRLLGQERRAQGSRQIELVKQHPENMGESREQRITVVAVQTLPLPVHRASRLPIHWHRHAGSSRPSAFGNSWRVTLTAWAHLHRPQPTSTKPLITPRAVTTTTLTQL